MKIFMDTEFIENQGYIDLISIGMVREDGETLYLQSTECDFVQAGDWVARNVLPQLVEFDMGSRTPIIQEIQRNGEVQERDRPWARRWQIREAILKFAPPEEKPQFWGYYADYDWVVFCWLFGSMVDLPEGYPRYCRDIKQLCDLLGNPQLPLEGKDEHNALSDALWNQKAYEFLELHAHKYGWEIATQVAR